MRLDLTSIFFGKQAYRGQGTAQPSADKWRMPDHLRVRYLLFRSASFPRPLPSKPEMKLFPE